VRAAEEPLACQVRSFLRALAAGSTGATPSPELDITVARLLTRLHTDVASGLTTAIPVGE
jgi:hypothetical protein